MLLDVKSCLGGPQLQKRAGAYIILAYLSIFASLFSLLRLVCVFFDPAMSVSRIIHPVIEYLSIYYTGSTETDQRATRKT